MRPLLSFSPSPPSSPQMYWKSILRKPTGLVLLNHLLWFRHFSAAPPAPGPPRRPPHHSTGHSGGSIYDLGPASPSFAEVSSFFGLCVWLVPFALFVSLSASDNVLPTTVASPNPMGADGSGGGSGVGLGATAGGGRRKRGLVRQIGEGGWEWVKEMGEAAGLWRGEGRGFRRF
jgi:hypothetical protein